jgi:RNA polymerase sigma-70 factor (ECF subfamily)
MCMQEEPESNAFALEEVSLRYGRKGRIANGQCKIPRVVLNVDPTALNQLFASCMPQLHRTAVLLLPTREDGEDALQDALLLGYRKLDQFKGESQFSTWMHSILINAARSLLRKQRTRPKTSAIDWDAHQEDERSPELSIADPRPNPEQEFRETETRGFASELLEALPPTYQPVIRLCDFEGLKMKEAAEMLNRPVGTVKCQLHRAHRLIRQQVRHQFTPKNGGQPRPPFKFPRQRLAPSSIPKAPSNLLLRLRPDSIPKPLWGRSAYQMLRRGAKWKQIRRDYLTAAGYRCAVCRANAQALSCHGIWRYDERNARAVLTGFEILCNACAAATNIGRAIRHGHDALSQRSRLNGMTLAEARSLSMETLKTWKERNEKKWRVSVAPFLLDRYPQLRVLASGNAVKEDVTRAGLPYVSTSMSGSLLSEAAGP